MPAPKQEKRNVKSFSFHESLDSIYADYEADMIRIISDPQIKKKYQDKAIAKFKKIVKAIEVLKEFNP